LKVITVAFAKQSIAKEANATVITFKGSQSEIVPSGILRIQF
jgi:hypothetical protein